MSEHPIEASPKRPQTSVQLFSLSAESANRPVHGLEILAVILLVLLSDLTIYRGHGFAGYTVFFFAAPLFLWLGSQRHLLNAWTLTLGIMLWLLAAKSLWLGSPCSIVVGTALLVGLAMTLSNFPPYLFELGI